MKKNTTVDQKKSVEQTEEQTVEQAEEQTVQKTDNAPSNGEEKAADVVIIPEPPATRYPGISVVIPYRADEANGQELRFALRSFEKNFKEPFHIVVIGDKEDWFDEENIIHIPFDSKDDNPQVNLIEILKIAIADERVTETFIWSNDDIYLLNEITTAHIAIPKALGKFEPEKYNGHYKSNMEKTIALLAEQGLPPVNYGTHTPLFFDKAKLQEMFEKFPEALKGDCLFESLYYIGQFPIILDWLNDNWLLPIISSNPDPKQLQSFSEKKFFLNNNPRSYSPTLEKFLYERFPEMSRFEIESR